ncbi:hypothetical protein V8G54_014380 [Vigna mungo]|uniref:Uncharacterized protein n=1 Tax=Vigna mungo TaxID=3915 RepID=A0AAQ3NJ40_VIGMU
MTYVLKFAGGPSHWIIGSRRKGYLPYKWLGDNPFVYDFRNITDRQVAIGKFGLSKDLPIKYGIVIYQRIKVVGNGIGNTIGKGHESLPKKFSILIFLCPLCITCHPNNNWDSVFPTPPLSLRDDGFHYREGGYSRGLHDQGVVVAEAIGGADMEVSCTCD